MIDVATAVRILQEAVPAPVVERVSLHEATGHFMAKDVRAPLSMPLFDQSAVDGYVLLNGPFTADEQFPVVGEIKAGDPAPRSVRHPAAYRIFTGAPVPKNAWCVVMQERINLLGTTVHVPVQWQVQGANIRLKGNHFKRKDLLLKKGDLLSPVGVALLASIGKSTVDVYRRPRVGIIVTGNELVLAGSPLRPGKIYESNSFFLRSALSAAGFEVVLSQSAVDSRQQLDRAVKKAMGNCDTVILTGGISVGKYDLVYEALESAGVCELFYKVAQKPGKPLFAGKKGRTIFFALPGNPAAVAVCFHRYVLPALFRMAGQGSVEDGVLRLPLLTGYELKGDRDLFLRARATSEGVELLSGQDSDNLFTFAHANALVYLSREQRSYQKGDTVEVIKL